MRRIKNAADYAVELLIDPGCIYSIERAWRRALAAEELPAMEIPAPILARLKEAEAKRIKLIEEAPWNRPFQRGPDE